MMVKISLGEAQVLVEPSAVTRRQRPLPEVRFRMAWIVIRGNSDKR